MVIIQDLVRHRALVQVVTIIISNRHQLPVINPSYHPKSMEAINQACPP